MFRLIKEIKPSYVVAENVPGILSIERGMVFEQVCSDLESEGYEVQTVIIPACAVNAPHRRDRAWFVAYSNNNGQQRGVTTNTKSQSGKRMQSEQSEISGSSRQEKEYGGSDSQTPIADTNLIQSQRRLYKNGRNEAERHISTCDSWDYRSSYWDNFPTQSPVCDRNARISNQLAIGTVFEGIGKLTFSKWRSESIKALGNAIVPQVAYQIFKAIEETF